MPSITLPQGTIDYVDEGDPSGTPVVAVHGFAADGDLWATTSAALGERVRVLRPTLPLGSHRSPMHGDPAPQDVAATLLAFLDELGLEDPILLGNDSGGAICQFAINARPDRVRRVVLTNCDGFEQIPAVPVQPAAADRQGARAVHRIDAGHACTGAAPRALLRPAGKRAQRRPLAPVPRALPHEPGDPQAGHRFHAPSQAERPAGGNDGVGRLGRRRARRLGHA